MQKPAAKRQLMICCGRSEMNLVFNQQSIALVRSIEGIYRLPDENELHGLELRISRFKPDNVALLASVKTVPLPVNGSAGVELLNLRKALGLLSPSIIDQIIFAQQLIYYEEQNRFCSQCGNQTVLNDRAQWLSCFVCQHDIYPRIAPAMIVAITKGDKLLMAQANHFAPEMWGLLAGFSEVGESLEQTVEREVMEEVGIQVKNIRYWGSQYWPFPNSLMVGFVAEYASGEIVLDTSEMRAAGFYGRDELPGRPSSGFSIASRMIDAFLEGWLSLPNGS